MPLLKARTVVFSVLISGLSAFTVLGQPSSNGAKGGSFAKITVLPNEKVAASMSRVERGDLVRIRAEEFRALKLQSVQRTTRITSARYRAKFIADPSGESHLVGTAEWSIHRPPKGNAILSLEGLQIALRQAKWSDGQEAILYKRSPQSSIHLFVPEGEGALNLEWSSRGITEPAEMRYELRVPPVPLAFLELELPSELTPVLPQAEALLTGPYPGMAGENTWRIAFGGLNRLELHLLQSNPAASPLLTRVTSTQHVGVQEATCRYEFQIEAAKSGFSELRFDHDTTFVPSSVVANNLVSWSPVGGEPALRVRFREPTRSASVVVTGTSAVVSTSVWTSPDVRLKDGILRTEKLNLIVAPGLAIRNWNQNGYRLTKSESTMDRSYSLELERSPFAASIPRVNRPEISVMPRGSGERSTTQHAEWTIGREEEKWEVRSRFNGVAATQTTIRFRLPLDWLVDRVEAAGREVVWSVSGTSKRVLEVEAGSSLRKGDVVVSLKRKRGDRPRERLDLPDLFPEGVARIGALTIRADPSIQVIVSDPIPGEKDANSTSNDAIVRPLQSFPLAGGLMLVNRPARERIEFESEWKRNGSIATVASSMRIRTGTGAVSELEFWTPMKVRGAWHWYDESGRWIAESVRNPIAETVSFLPWMAPRSAWINGLTLASVPHSMGSHWKIRFAKPLDRDTNLRSTVEAFASDELPRVPLFQPKHTAFTGVVHSPGQAPFVYGNPAFSAIPDGQPDPEWRGGRIIFSVDAEGSVLARFRVFVRRWATGSVPIVLPTTADSPEIRLGGRSIRGIEGTTDSRVIDVPMSRTENWTSIDVQYRLPPLKGWLSARTEALRPTGPFKPESIRNFWQVSPEWKPAVPATWQTIPGTGERGTTLPLPDLRTFANPRPTSVSDDKNRTRLIDVIAIQSNDEAGRVLVECEDGVLVTTQAELDLWRREAGWFSRWPGEIDESIQAAFRTGRDPSGRFVTMEQWERTTMDDNHVYRVPAGWVILEAPGVESDPLQLLHRERLTYASWLTLIGFLGLTLLLADRRHARQVAIGALAAGSIILWFVAPSFRSEIAGPGLFIAAVGVILQYLQSVKVSVVPRTSSKIVRRSSVLVGGVFIATAILHAAETDENEVFEIRDRDGQVQAYLVPVKWLERSRESQGLTPHAPVILSAQYTASLDKTTAHFRATYHLYAFEDVTSRVTFPLTQARIRSVSLDGAEARDVETGVDGLRVFVAAKGMHVLEMQFSLPIASIGNEREMRCPIPEVPRSRLSIDLIGSAVNAHTGVWRGAVTSSVIPGSRRLEADLGTSSSIVLRWPENAEQKTAIRVKQAGIWQITGPSATLNSILDFRAVAGGTRTIQLAIPANAEISRLSVGGDGLIPPTNIPRIRSWNVTPPDANGERKLTVEFQSMISNRVLLTLEMVLTAPLSEKVELTYPRALGIAEFEAYAAIAAPENEAIVGVATNGVTAHSSDAFLQDVWPTLEGRSYSGKLHAAYRMSGQTPARINLTLQAKPSEKSVSGSIVWWVDSSRAIANAESHWTGPNLSTLEWALPSDFAVTDLQGKGLSSWWQSAGTVRVWLEKPVNDVSLTWTAVGTRPAAEASKFVVPPVTYSGTTNESVLQRVRTTNGQVLSQDKRPTPKTPLSPIMAGEVAWQGARPQQLTLEVLPPQDSVSLPIRTTIQQSGTRIQCASAIDLSGLRRDRPHILSIFVQECKDCEVAVSGSGSIQAHEIPQTGTDRRWDLFLPIETLETRLATVTISPRTISSETWNLPRVHARIGPTDLELGGQILVLQGDALSLIPSYGLDAISRREWRIVDPEWRAAISRANVANFGHDAHISSASIVVERVGGYWHHHAEFTVHASRAGQFKIEAPFNSQSIDTHRPGVIALNPSFPTAVRRTWISSEPNWLAPRLMFEDLPIPPPEIEWKVCVPYGWKMQEGGTVPGDRVASPMLVPDRDLPGTMHTLFMSGPPQSQIELQPSSPREWLRPLGISLAILLAAFALGWRYPDRAKAIQPLTIAALSVYLLGPAAAVLGIAAVFLLIRLAFSLVRVRNLSMAKPDSIISNS